MTVKKIKNSTKIARLASIPLEPPGNTNIE